ncbi:MAG TPA: hypothetical protein VFZ24_15700 [Longimicrobiales bacterium]
MQRIGAAAGIDLAAHHPVPGTATAVDRPGAIRTDILILAAFAVLLCLPLLLTGIPRASDDGLFHVLAFRHFAEQLFAGHAYPRWLPDMNAGYGSPLFFYYAPAAYYAAALLSPVTFWTSDPWLEIGFAAWAAIAISGIALYGWLRGATTRRAALAAAILYMVVPYHLAIDTYVRGAYAEVWAFAWLPLVPAAVRARVGIAAVLAMAVAVALLLTTHPPTALLLAPFAAAYAAFESRRARSVKPLLGAVAGATLGSALAAAYLMPALLLRDAVFADVMQWGMLNFRRWFLFDAAPDPPFKRQLTLMLTTMAGTILVAELVVRRAARAAAVRRFWVVAGAIAFVAMTAIALPLWEQLRVLQQVQFPWRLGSVLSLALAAAVAHAVAAHTGSAEVPALVRFVYAPGIALLWLAFTAQMMLPRQAPPWIQPMYDRDALPAVEYRPADSEFLWRTRTDDGRTLLPGAPRVTAVRGAGTASVLSWESRRIELRTSAGGPMTLELRQLHFTGWTARPLSGDTPIPTRASPLGLLWIDVPPGRHTLTLSLTRTAAERQGSLVSIIAFLGAALLAVIEALRRRRAAVRAVRADGERAG